MRTKALLLMLGAVALGMVLDTSTVYAAATPAPTNGSVAFVVAGAGLPGPRTICLSVSKSKAGLKNLVCGTVHAGEVSGKHTFPQGTNAAGIVAYYDGLLANSGWAKPADYTVGGNTINFFGITKLDSGAAPGGGVTINGATDSKNVPYNGKVSVKAMSVTRSSGQDGMITLVGFGISWDTTNQQITTTTSEVTVPFAAADSATAILQAIRDALTAAGWTASIDADGLLEISKNASGDSIYSLWHSIEYLGDGTNDDDWIFEDLQ
jgi:hypothetical protein